MLRTRGVSSDEEKEGYGEKDLQKGFGSVDNSTCHRVLDLLQPGDLRLGQFVIKRVAVIQLGVD